MLTASLSESDVEPTSRKTSKSDLPTAAVAIAMPFTWTEVAVSLLMRWTVEELSRDLAHVKPARSFGQSSSDAFADPCREVVQWMLFLWDLCSSRIGIFGRTASS